MWQLPSPLQPRDNAAALSRGRPSPDFWLHHKSANRCRGTADFRRQTPRRTRPRRQREGAVSSEVQVSLRNLAVTSYSELGKPGLTLCAKSFGHLVATSVSEVDPCRRRFNQ